ncbi:unnamed protein product, partial [Closterium sp. Naga37s-1]
QEEEEEEEGGGEGGKTGSGGGSGGKGGKGEKGEKGAVKRREAAESDGAGKPEETVVVRFEVRDTGVGMDEAAKGRLFKAFSQADNSTSRRYGGTGLGLAICKSLCFLMGGDIGMHSQVGEGSTFFFYVRMQRVNPKENPKPAGESATSSDAEPLWVQLQHIRVLVAEDNKVNQMVATRMLHNLGLKYDVVENGRLAVQACTDRHYDVVLMDCHMPEMDGYEATRHIRAMEEERLAAYAAAGGTGAIGRGSGGGGGYGRSGSRGGYGSSTDGDMSEASSPSHPHSSSSSRTRRSHRPRRTFIVALTASALSEDKDSCMAVGMDHYLAKPIRPRDLERVIREGMVKRRRESISEEVGCEGSEGSLSPQMAYKGDEGPVSPLYKGSERGGRAVSPYRGGYEGGERPLSPLTFKQRQERGVQERGEQERGEQERPQQRPQQQQQEQRGEKSGGYSGGGSLKYGGGGGGGGVGFGPSPSFGAWQGERDDVREWGEREGGQGSALDAFREGNEGEEEEEEDEEEEEMIEQASPFPSSKQAGGQTSRQGSGRGGSGTAEPLRSPRPGRSTPEGQGWGRASPRGGYGGVQSGDDGSSAGSPSSVRSWGRGGGEGGWGEGGDIAERGRENGRDGGMERGRGREGVRERDMERERARDREREMERERERELEEESDTGSVVVKGDGWSAGERLSDVEERDGEWDEGREWGRGNEGERGDERERGRERGREREEEKEEEEEEEEEEMVGVPEPRRSRTAGASEHRQVGEERDAWGERETGGVGARGWDGERHGRRGSGGEGYGEVRCGEVEVEETRRSSTMGRVEAMKMRGEKGKGREGRSVWEGEEGWEQEREEMDGRRGRRSSLDGEDVSRMDNGRMDKQGGKGQGVGRGSESEFSGYGEGRDGRDGREGMARGGEESEGRIRGSGGARGGGSRGAEGRRQGESGAERWRGERGGRGEDGRGGEASGPLPPREGSAVCGSPYVFEHGAGAESSTGRESSEWVLLTGESSEWVLLTGESSEWVLLTGESSEWVLLTGESSEWVLLTGESSEWVLLTGEESSEWVLLTGRGKQHATQTCSAQEDRERGAGVSTAPLLQPGRRGFFAPLAELSPHIPSTKLACPSFEGLSSRSLPSSRVNADSNVELKTKGAEGAPRTTCSLKAMRDRIESVKNTQKITDAMKLVAAAKVRRAQEAVVNGRPFSENLVKVLYNVNEQLQNEDVDIPLTEVRPVKKVAIVVNTGDRGLCGGFNNYVLKKAEARVAELTKLGVAYTIVSIGKKGNAFFKRRPQYAVDRYLEVGAAPTTKEAQAIADEIFSLFVSEEVDKVELIYTKFVSLIKSDPVVHTLLPLSPAGEVCDINGICVDAAEDELFRLTTKEGKFAVERETIRTETPEFTGVLGFEQEPVQILDALLPLYLNSQILRALQESLASELAARMNAMGNASDNAKELKRNLNLTYNRRRQAKITGELIEIVSGASA